MRRGGSLCLPGATTGGRLYDVCYASPVFLRGVGEVQPGEFAEKLLGAAVAVAVAGAGAGGFFHNCAVECVLQTSVRVLWNS